MAVQMRASIAQFVAGPTRSKLGASRVRHQHQVARRMRMRFSTIQADPFSSRAVLECHVFVVTHASSTFCHAAGPLR